LLQNAQLKGNLHKKSLGISDGCLSTIWQSNEAEGQEDDCVIENSSVIDTFNDDTPSCVTESPRAEF
jgi:hypothetical protein